VDLGAQVSGQVSKINVKLGQQVKKGDVLISLDPKIARNEVAQAEAALAQQTALIDARQADLQFTQNELGRQRRLLASQATTVSEFEKAELDLLKLQADLRGQMANLKNLQAQLENRRLQLGFTTITAPIDGVVISLPVQEGQTVIALQSTTLLLSLANLEDMTVRARIPEADISYVQVGQQAYFTTFSGETNRYKGLVRAIEPMPERVGNAVFYNVLFDVNNKARKLLSNMTVQVSIITGEAKGVLTIPTVALSERAEDGSYTVQVVTANDVLQSRLIQIGLQDDGKVQVKNGLKVGEKVLLAPPQSESSSEASQQAK
jgi:macrolide-specific efflux system membrane fusion protein